MLDITSLEKSFDTADGPVPVLRGVSLSVKEGDTLALTGESGSGKSTLLHLMAGLDDAQGGKITFEGQDLLSLSDADRAKVRRSRIGLVFQQFNLVPSLTVAQNLALQARLAAHAMPEGAAWAREAREDALSRLRAMGGLPGKRDEYWKFTDPTTLNLPEPPRAQCFATDESAPFSEIDRLRIVFVDGVFDAEASDDLALEGVEIERLSDAQARDIQPAPTLGEHSDEVLAELGLTEKAKTS